jgi:hypothetical protein
MFFFNRLAKVCHEVDEFCRNLQTLSTSSQPESLKDRKYISCRYLSFSFSIVPQYLLGDLHFMQRLQLSVLLLSNFWIRCFVSVY